MINGTKLVLSDDNLDLVGKVLYNNSSYEYSTIQTDPPVFN